MRAVLLASSVHGCGPADRDASSGEDRLDSLTDSQLKVASLVATGATNRDIARQLHLSIHTVKTHVHKAFAKLAVTSREQLARLPRKAD